MLNLKNKKIKKILPLLNEWNNSICNFNKNGFIKTLLIKDIFVYKLFTSYFNLKKIKLLKKKNFSILKVFISKQDIKHYNSNLSITLCLYNKENISYKKYIYKLFKYKLLTTKKFKKIINKKNNKIINCFINKFIFNINSIFFNKNLLLKYKQYYILRVLYILKKYKLLFVLKKKIIKLKFLYYKYNFSNLIGLKNILYKIYKKKIEFNIINLKYLYLDSNILSEILGAKLKNRKVNLLKNIVKSIGSLRIPYVQQYSNLRKIYNDYNHMFLINNSFNKDIGTIKNYIYTYMEKLNIVFINLKYKTVNGIKVQASGRLTRRLTALRSVSKFKQKGSLKNIYSSYEKVSTNLMLGYLSCNIQYINKNYNNRNGSYGIKTHISSY